MIYRNALGNWGRRRFGGTRDGCGSAPHRRLPSQQRGHPVPQSRGATGGDFRSWGVVVGGLSCGFKRCGAAQGPGQGALCQLVDALVVGWFARSRLHGAGRSPAAGRGCSGHLHPCESPSWRFFPGAVRRQRVVAARCGAALAQDPVPPPGSASLSPLPFLPASPPASFTAKPLRPRAPGWHRQCWSPAHRSPVPHTLCQPHTQQLFQHPFLG